MSIFKCKMCGGNIEFEPGATIGVCDSCGTKQTLPRLDDERRANLYDRANHFRRNNDFDKAAGIYEQILNEDAGDAEAYWSLVLCRYGIEYVEDPTTRKRVPTVNRAQFTSIFDDDNYKSAIERADGYQREIYEKEAKEINEIQKGILAISQKEEPFDVFICYKETDKSGRRTPDSVLANDLYHQLSQEGFKVFFSRITLEDKLGTAYEPYIFAALNSAKVMVVLGTKPEHFNAVWVKNEWSRYLAIVKKSGGKKILIPAYKDMDPYDLPEEFSHLQAQDMSKLGFMQDLIRVIKKIVRADEPKQTVKETVVVGGDAPLAPLLKRAAMFLEEKRWKEADECYERVLDRDPENAQAYSGKLMAEVHACNKEDLENCKAPFDKSDNYLKAVRFGDDATKTFLKGCIAVINERVKAEQDGKIYDYALKTMNAARSEEEFLSVKKRFEAISGFKNADELSLECGIKIEKLKEEKKRKKEERRKKAKKAAIIVAPIVAACVALVLITIFIIVPSVKRGKAQELIAAGEYESAYAILKEIGDQDAINANKRERAMVLIDRGKYTDAYALLEEAGAEDVINKNKRDRAKNLIKEGKYERAYALLKEAGAEDVIKKNKRERAAAHIEKAEYDQAYALLNEIGDTETINSNKRERAAAHIEKAEYDQAYALLNEIGDTDAITQNKRERAFILIDEEHYDDAFDLLYDVVYDDTIKAKIREKATELFEREEYDTAYYILREIRDQDMINENKRERGYAYLEQGEYEKGYAFLNGIVDNETIAASKYENAKALIADENYEMAYTLLKGIDYEDSKDVLTSIKPQYERIMLSRAGYGATVSFGTYVISSGFNNNTGSFYEEVGDLQWIVLEKEGDKLLLISKIVLDKVAFAEERSSAINWEDSLVRSWLNETFLNNVFLEGELEMIATTSVKADSVQEGYDPGNDTEDKIFLLSVSEAEKYFPSADARICPSAKYRRQTWWLRSVGSYNGGFSYAYCVGTWGEITNGYSVDSAEGVRPVMWVSIGE